MGSDRRIDAFFTRAPKPSNNGGGGEAVKENKRSAAENESGAVEGGPKKAAAAEAPGRRFKRLKRADEGAAAPAEAADADALVDDVDAAAPAAAQDADIEAVPSQQQQKEQHQQQQQEEEVKQEEAKSKAAVAQGGDKSGAKMSPSEASAAFSKLFAKPGGKAGPGTPSKKASGVTSPSKASNGQQQQQQQKAAGAAAAASPASGAKAKAAAAKKATPTRAAGDADGDEEYEDGDDDAGSSASGDGSDDDDDGAAVAAAGGGAKKAAATGAKKKASAATGKKKAKGVSDVDGVGAGAVEAAARYADAEVAALPAGAPVPYAFLTQAFEAIATTTKRLEITAVLAGAFRAIIAAAPDDLLPTVYLCSNRVGPPHEGLELGVGDAILVKALAESTGRKEATVKREYEAEGDLGAVAAASRSAQRTLGRPARLTVAGVFKRFREIATASGNKSQERKRALIKGLLVAAVDEEPGYIVRSLQGKLRIGLAEQSLLAALAHAVSLHAAGAGGGVAALAERLAAAEACVKQAYSECPSFDRLVPALVQHPLSELSERVTFTPGVPVRPMLAKPTNGVAEVLDKFGAIEFTCEYKYDGERCQIHVQRGGQVVALYSRNAEDQTPKFPDIVARVPGWLAPGTDSIVIDAEAVAWDPVAKRIQPFQVLSTRARKDVAVADIKVPVVVFAFDCLYVNGRSLLHAPLSERRAAMRAHLVPAKGELDFATAKTSRDVEELAAFLNEAVAASTEGLIVKTLDDVYQPSRRSNHWLKLKKDYLDGCGDTFDVVPIGAYYGKGKRSGVFGAYLLAVYDADAEAYQTISKLGTGFSEEALVELDAALRPHVIDAPRPYYQFGDGQAPDVWLDPAAVWEVKAADLSVSPVHQAARGLVEPGKGISIRFPRLIRVRDDKKPEDATTAAQVADMYRAQAVVAANANRGAGGGGGDGDDD